MFIARGTEHSALRRSAMCCAEINAEFKWEKHDT